MRDDAKKTGRSHLSSPYQGLIPYEARDADFFFGREGDTRLIIANLYSSPFTLLYGMSGVGKSSVVRAGVAHKLHTHDDVLVVVFADWEKDPLAELKKAIDMAALSAARATGKQPEFVPEPSAGLSERLAAWTASLERRLMIILDQFEDYLQYHPKQTPFADEFSKAVMQADVPASFLISIREDSLAKLDRFEGSIPILFDNYLRLEHLNRNAARDAIKKPIERYNELYVTDGEPYTIEEDLVNVVLQNVKAGLVPLGHARGNLLKAEERKSQFDTVYLQLIMTRLWDEEKRRGFRVLRRSTLDVLGGVARIVRDHLDAVMDTLEPEEKSDAAKIFKYLVTPSGTKVAYSVKDLAALENIPADRLTTMLRKISEGENRILRPVTPPPSVSNEMMYEIFHDSLGTAILDWRNRYLREQEKIRIQEELEREQQEQMLRQKKAIERLERKNRNLLLITIFVSFFFLVIFILASIAWRSRNAARAAELNATMQKQEADKHRVKAEEALSIVRKQDLAPRHMQSALRGHSESITNAAFSPDGHFAVTTGRDNTARVWNVETSEQVKVLEGHAAPLTDVAYSNDGRYVLTASEDHTARLWNTETWTHVEMVGHNGAVTSASFNSNGTYVVTSSSDGTACVWKTENNRCETRLTGHESEVFAARFSPDDALVVTASSDGTARIWDARNEQQPRDLREHSGIVYDARFSRSGKLVVTAGQDSTARIWDVKTGNQLNVLRGHEGEVYSAEFDLTGEFVVTASADKTARVWRTGRGNLASILRGHTERINTAKFSQNGERVVTASDDKTARVWNPRVQKQNELAELSGHTGRVVTAFFGPGDALILTASGDQTARVYTAQFQRFRIAEVFVEPIEHYPGPCPATITLKGKIVAEGYGTIFYRFVRSDGIPLPLREMEVSSESPAYVNLHFRVNESNTPIRAEYSLVIEQPYKDESEKAKLRVRCAEATTEPPPPPTPEPTP